MSLLALAAVLTFSGGHTLVSKDAGVTLLVVLMALKTLELRARRDALVVFFLGFFLVLTTFLYSQSFLTALGTGVSVWGWLTALTLAHMPAGRPTIRQAASLAGRAALIGTPVMVALFVLFPRIGPLWPAANDAARTGLSDHLELGSVADLASDDSIAFRLRFDGKVPNASEMYFRGPVLTDTDGREWRAQSQFDTRARRELRGRTLAIEQHGDPITYEMTLEPTQLTWLPMLELTPPPAASPAPAANAASAGGTGTEPGIRILDGAEVRPVPDVDLQWRTRRPLSQRVRLRATSWPDDRIVGATPADLREDLALPPGFFPRTRAWSTQWLASHRGRSAPEDPPDADAVVASLYGYIGSAGFTYTLTPGAYEADPVDEFWLDRRVGFCEHFATSFVVVLRAMGIPARVVTGYQGTDAKPTDGYLVVRQSNAHAWAEYWNPARGWVRADPTAAVAPERIEHGRAIQPRPGFVGNALDSISPGLLDRVRVFRETMDNRWKQWVLGYNRTTQFDLLKQIGVSAPDTDDLGHALIGLVVAAASFGAVAAWWDAHRRTPGQRIARKLAGSLRALEPHGVRVAPHESPGGIAATLRQRFGGAAASLAAVLESMERTRYGPPSRLAHGAGGRTRGSWRRLRTEARALAARLAATVPRDRKAARTPVRG
jgi:transglutaminase-like putative cysteine protease